MTDAGEPPGARQATHAAAAAVTACGEAAKKAAGCLVAAPDAVIDAVLRRMAVLLTEQAPAILAANAADMNEGASQGLGRGLLDRLRLDPGRLEATGRQLGLLAKVPFPRSGCASETLANGLTLT
ncbi:MAG: hypothetical protein ACRDNF_08085, partial [Streptosporangiaceae bacterium]